MREKTDHSKNHMVLNLLRTSWAICVLRKGPQDMPYSFIFFWLALLINAFIGWGQLSLQQEGGLALTETVGLVAVSLLYVYALLRFSGGMERYIQTISAMMIAGAMVVLLIWPIVHVFLYVMKNNEQGSFVFLWANLSVLILVVFANIWTLLISAHIFRHSLNQNFFVGLLVAIGLIAMHILVYNFLHY